VEEYRTFWRRFWAGVIDSLVLWGVFYIPGRFDDYFSSPERGAATIIFWSLLLSVLTLAYTIVLHARYGQTIGKMVAKVHVLDVEETALPTYRQAVLRDIGVIAFHVLSVVLLAAAIFNGTYTNDLAAVDPESVTIPWYEVVVGLAGFAWFVLEVVTMLFNKKRRALHDFIAGTVVVKTSEHDI